MDCKKTSNVQSDFGYYIMLKDKRFAKEELFSKIYNEEKNYKLV
jgi:hypothetical protein